MTNEHGKAGYDAIVVGGSYAGLAATMQLVRARRRVLVLDAGERRNRFAATSHGFLGQDGRPPADIAAQGRREVEAYPTLSWQEDLAVLAEKQGDAFCVASASGKRFVAHTLILASGVIDELPDIDGLAERWGRSVFHCPYCHGYELDQGRIGVLAVGPVSMHHALMLPDWGQVTLLTNASFTPDAAQRAALAQRGVTVEACAVARIVEHAVVELTDGRRLAFAGLFTASRTHVANPLPAQLGCAFDEGPMGRYIRTDETRETSVQSVFACGDVARTAGNVAFAVGDGAMAGVGAHRRLMFGRG
ncbi:NAD(P)/FAD-dependent oxidoreductase [Chitinasiproducens palmae]|uniref:Thioredoxin reductase n=1 Tax=Chitinasiproducens palmae TaxID=1770053 RepID=A0A1H2PIM0_9BURK|nr:NAD(P)/FAD-dependent oxidoreductase [Chitinasiproducens palmae]SDV46028.1 Thioredoxin reductase [Chitinasiproducens palmae]